MVKKALFIGINYVSTPYALKGCVNDCLNCSKLLCERFNFLKENCRFQFDIAVEGFTNNNTPPTRENILAGLAWLRQDIVSGDSIYLHYSGHGTQIKDTNNDEKDGQDECLVPMDWTTAGVITDDLLRSEFLDRIPVGVTVRAVIDSCHSGTMFDLPFSYRGPLWSPSAPRLNEFQRTSRPYNGPDVLMFSGCRDNQTSADAVIAGQNVGAMTQAFCSCLSQWYEKNTKPPTVAMLLDLIRAKLKSGNFTQITQVNCSQQFSSATQLLKF
jgi:metacaspase-1